MPKHNVGTREEWKAAVAAVHEREQELGAHDEELMFSPTYEAACPGCTGLTDHFDATLLDQVPDGRDVDFPLRRHDEY